MTPFISAIPSIVANQRRMHKDDEEDCDDNEENHKDDEDTSIKEDPQGTTIK